MNLGALKALTGGSYCNNTPFRSESGVALSPGCRVGRASESTCPTQPVPFTTRHKCTPQVYISFIFSVQNVAPSRPLVQNVAPSWTAHLHMRRVIQLNTDTVTHSVRILAPTIVRTWQPACQGARVHRPLLERGGPRSPHAPRCAQLEQFGFDATSPYSFMHKRSASLVSGLSNSSVTSILRPVSISATHKPYVWSVGSLYGMSPGDLRSMVRNGHCSR